jgi:DtxR family transcriptional regulator, Mn-dependent transcriptional regulator
MLPSSTVENYLKAIYQAQGGLSSEEGLVPMGQLAAALGVVPGTATTMVKTLAESGLVRYEPYAGVRLSPAGEKLAALVLRRHRLIELFLVKVMGMRWDEVHDEAEHLEHAVSDRLIDRIDEMLGRPAVDPHGDPIPDPDGAVDRLDYDTLLTCPLHAEVTVRRVADQDAEFLRFVERQDLKPGAVVRVEERDMAGDSVRLRAGGNRDVTIGARAASKVLVQSLALAVALLTGAGGALAQPSARPVEPFQIMDNSFLVEEAYNQERGVFQNLFTAVRSGGLWAAAFTQEWPVPSETHQLSYRVTFLDSGLATGFGDVMVDYRYQALTEGPGRPAVAPRLSLILPTGDAGRGLGEGAAGLEFNVPVSKQTGDWMWHWNGGVTWFPRGSHVTPFTAASAIYRLRPMLNLMLEGVISFEESLLEQGSARETAFTLSPGLRQGWNLGDQQLVLGAALPVTWHTGRDIGAFVYFSYELPFRTQ